MAEHVSFASTSGPRLAGLVDHPTAPLRGWGVFSHGFTLGKDCAAASRICKQLAHEGIGMLRFDNLGLGGSEGDWGDGSFSNKVADTAQAVRFMNESGRTARPTSRDTSSTTTTRSSSGSSPTGRRPSSSGARPSPCAATSWTTSARWTYTSRSARCAGPCW